MRSKQILCTIGFLSHLQISTGQTLTGRTCATALSACVQQGMIWVCPNPGAALSQDSIPGQLEHICLQCFALLLLESLHAQIDVS